MLTIAEGIKRTLFQIRSLIWNKDLDLYCNTSLKIEGRNNTLCYFDITEGSGDYQLQLTFCRNLKFLGYVKIDFSDFDSFDFEKVKEWCFIKTPFEISLLHKNQWWEVED